MNLPEPFDDGEEHGATVVPCENGPLLLRGDFTLRTPGGEVIDAGRTTVALCRCGRSAAKPFCDGTHKAVKFRAGAGRDTATPRPTG
jgi:CDGSH-type Zn-finger protein